MEKKEALLYLAPHQDDELTNLGVDLCREAAGGKEVWCLLFTDGSSSFVRTFLANGEPCPLHEGRHVYPMDRAEFARARDREFLSSLGAMGVMPGRAVILPGRAQDGSLSKERAKELLLAFLAELPGRKITLKSVMPMRSVRHIASVPNSVALKKVSVGCDCSSALSSADIAMPRWSPVLTTPP